MRRRGFLQALLGFVGVAGAGAAPARPAGELPFGAVEVPPVVMNRSWVTRDDLISLYGAPPSGAVGLAKAAELNAEWSSLAGSPCSARFWPPNTIIMPGDVFEPCHGCFFETAPAGMMGPWHARLNCSGRRA